MSSPIVRPQSGSDRPPAAGLADWIGRHQAYVWRFLRYLGARSDVAEDLTQEAFLAAIAEGVPDREPAKATAWLRTTTLNLYRMHLRRQRRRRETLPLDDLESMFVEPGHMTSYMEALDQCLLGLADRERRALHLRYSVGASRGEMAQDLGVSEEGVKSLLRRVKERLRVCIEKRIET